MSDLDILLEALSAEEIGKASNTLANARVANLRSWGSSPENNILYVCGFSGGGKSTVSSLLGEIPNVIVLHLDGYLQDESDWTHKYETHEFTNFLKKHKVDFHNMVSDYNKLKANDEAAKIRLRAHVKAFEQVLDDYSRHAFAKGYRIVVEGVQIGFPIFRIDKSFFSDKPMIITSTSAVAAARRKIMRDNDFRSVPIDELVKTLKNIIKWYSVQNSSLKKLEKNLKLEPYYNSPINFNV